MTNAVTIAKQPRSSMQARSDIDYDIRDQRLTESRPQSSVPGSGTLPLQDPKDLESKG
jgi:hypothetical protein